MLAWCCARMHFRGRLLGCIAGLEIRHASQLMFPLSVCGFRFIGKPSKEKVFHAQRKEREVEWNNAASAEEAEALKANKVRLSSVTYRRVLGLVCCVLGSRRGVTPSPGEPWE